MPKNRITVAQRKIVFERAKGCCEYCFCQARFSPDPFAGEHIIPVYAGGETNLNNLALACFGCNGHKHTKTSAIDPETNVEAPLFHPRQHRWYDHFAWNEQLTHIIGLTPIGRATIPALQLNREELINLRRILCLVGEHPPQL
jgi:HNH endonuclease